MKNLFAALGCAITLTTNLALAGPLDRVAEAGVSCNRFHSTAMYSPTRSALLSGRKQSNVGKTNIEYLRK